MSLYESNASLFVHLLELARFLVTPSLNNEDCSGLYLLATTCSYTGGDVSEVGKVGVPPDRGSSRSS